MLPRLTNARHHDAFRVWLRFSDGAEGIIDLTAELHGPMFDALQDPARFAQLRLDPALHTLVWPSGADLAPEFLRECLRAAA